MSILGIDIGGSNMRGILWNGSRIVRRVQYATPQTKGAFVKKFQLLVWKIKPSVSLRGIGIGVAAVLRGTRLESATNIRTLDGLDFKTIAPRGVPLRVDNDARCFARGECLLGAGRGARRLLAFTIGTGIGRACAEHRKVLKIKRLEYPEPWEKQYQVLRDAVQRKKISEDRLVAFLGERLVALARRYRPGVIVIGGGVPDRRKEFFRKLKRELGKRGVVQSIRKSSLGRNAAALGAALLFREASSVKYHVSGSRYRHA